jgi:hypothetical protein
LSTSSIIKPYSFRPYTLDDIPFIHSSWGNSYYLGLNGHTLIKEYEFHSYHRPIRDKILNRPNIAIIVCSTIKDPDLIIAYIILEKPEASPNVMIIHYLYVKHDFKNQGIAKDLFNSSIHSRPILFTHRTNNLINLIHRFRVRSRPEIERCFFAPHLI